MPLTSQSAEGIAHLEEQMMNAVPTDGTSIGNMRLRDDVLRWSHDLYLAVRARLLDRGELITGRGKGGSVRRPVVAAALEPPMIQLGDPIREGGQAFVQDPYPDETALYEAITTVVRERWVQEQSFDQVLVENTNRGGRRRDGIWTRPDLTIAAMTSYTYVPGKHFDVISFEIKHHTGFNVTAIYEALAHRRAATRSYVLVYIPDGLLEAFENPTLAEITDEASRHGIGLIVASDPANFDTWDIREEATRINPDPSRLNAFIRNQLSEGTRDQIVRWFR